MKNVFLAPAALLAGLAVAGPLSAPVSAQTIRTSQPGFNLFTVQQDVEIGRQSATEAEKQLPLLTDRVTNNYLTRIVRRLALYAPGAKYQYTVKAVNAPEINAFAFPGGPLYVNRGLIEAARSEAELAGVLAHEMSHIALRHGTHQASKAYATKSGLGLLGGLFGRPSGTTSSIVNALGGVGLNAVFMKFSRDDEYQADQTGAQMMVGAGYDPLAMATLFEMLQAQQQSQPGKVEQFFASHPPAADRGQRIRRVATQLGTGQPQVLGGYDNLKERLARISPSTSTVVTQPSTTDPVIVNDPTSEPVTVTIPAPATRFARFTHGNGFFTIDYPNNWRAVQSGHGVTIAPTGGIVAVGTRRVPAVVYGVVLNHYAPFEGETERWNSSLQRNYTPFEDRNSPRGTLEDATDDLIRQVIRTNPYLQPQTGSTRAETIDGEPGYSLVLSGRSPLTNEDERVTVYTRTLPDGHVIYALAIAPARDADALERTFGRMVGSLRVNDAAAHRATTTASSSRVIP